MLVFFDDMLVFNSDLNSHQNHLLAVLQKLKDNKPSAKRSKCEFGVREIEYLGHIISDKGVSTHPKKIEVMKNLAYS